jgi:hypothetical protein
MKNARRRVAASALVVAFAASAHAYVSDGHEYELRCTDDGYQLTSKYSVTRTVGSGAGTRYVSGREELYLGRSCDAYHKLFGYGEWCWANGGFFADFSRHRFEFWRQELWCEPRRDYDLNCRC